MIDINRAIKQVLSTGKVTVGAKETKKAASNGEVKLVIVASNSVERDFHGVPIHAFAGTNMELGTICGKPFSISVLGVVDQGDSNILSLRESD
ncbi:MAG: 50S ribosomal protein L30e [Candidatus Thermoplasmatota archaeon]|nr:50S ribosomal protein L30e [Candidatus Thermoplasmatota archaeon]